MAHEVIFESERLERRRRVKRWLVPTVGILLLLVGIIAVAVVLRGRTVRVAGGEDTPYPYTWTADRTGAALLEIDCSAAPGYTWRTESVSGGISVTPSAQGSQGKTAFTLTPAGSGRAMLSFVLCGTGDPTDRIYGLDFLAETGEVGDRLQSLPVSVSGHAIQGVVRGGNDGAFPYTLRTDEDGDLCIAVALPQTSEEGVDARMGELFAKLEAGEISEEALAEAYLEMTGQGADWDWDSDSSDEGVALSLGVIYGEGEVSAYFRPGPEQGSVTLRLFDSVSGVCITAECENGTDGLMALSHREDGGQK